MSDVDEFLNDYHDMLANGNDTTGFPAEILETYRFDSCLKHGEDSEVFLVTDRRTEGKAVLRVTSQQEDMAEIEWGILSKLDHPGIPKTYGRLTAGDKSYIAREYIPGQPLDDVASNKTMGIEEINSLVCKLCDIMEYLHQQEPPIIHRDIKPQNIIVRPDGSIVLTDFGIARTFKPGADSDTRFAGTLPYAPPEQYGYAQSTPQTDIYALGIVLVYLATGSPNRQNLPDKIADKKLLALIERCIAFDPADRFASAADIRRFIEGKLDEELAGELDSELDKRPGERFYRKAAGEFKGEFNRGSEEKRDEKRKARPKHVVRLSLSAGLAALAIAVTLFIIFDPLAMRGPLDNLPDGSDGISEPESTQGPGDDSSGKTNAENTQTPEEDSSGRTNAENTQDLEEDSAYEKSAEGPLYNPAKMGNLPGNIVNNGRAVESAEDVFVATKSGIYVLDPSRKSSDGALGRQLTDFNTKSLNYHEGKLYYSAFYPGHLGCIDLATGEESVLFDGGVDGIYFDRGTLYFENENDEGRLYTIELDGSGLRKVSDHTSVRSRSISGGYQYFVPQKEARLYRANLETGDEEVIYENKCYYVSLYGKRLYLLDESNSRHGIVAIDLDGANPTRIANGRFICPIASPEGIFCMDNNGQIFLIDHLGRQRTLLVATETDFFWATRDWLIYENREDDFSLWMVNHDGSVSRPLLP